MGIEIEEIDWEELVEKSARCASFEERLDLLLYPMVVTQRNITKVACAFNELQDQRLASYGKFQEIEKAVDYYLTRRGVIKDILKGEARSMMDREFWVKEMDKVKGMSRRAFYV